MLKGMCAFFHPQISAIKRLIAALAFRLFSQNFDGRRVLGRRHFGHLLELPREIMDRGVSQVVGYLGEIHVVVTDQLLCHIDFHFAEIVDHTAVVLVAEELLELGTSDYVIFADLLYGQMLLYVVFKIVYDTGIELVFIFLFEGLWKRAVHLLNGRISSVKLKEELLQEKLDQLF